MVCFQPSNSCFVGRPFLFPKLPRLLFSQECILEDPNVVDEVDTMMSSLGMGQVSAKATSALSSAKAWFTGKKRTDLFI